MVDRIYHEENEVEREQNRQTGNLQYIESWDKKGLLFVFTKSLPTQLKYQVIRIYQNVQKI